MSDKKWDNYQKPTAKELKQTLEPLQFKVTQKDGTEKPFKNEYWDNTEEGIYVDLLSGEPLFLSKHKYKSGTGWPTFFDVLSKESTFEKADNTLFRKDV